VLDRPSVWAGQHTDELLANLGLDAVTVARYHERGVVG
jgi:hypothetical protein